MLWIHTKTETDSLELIGTSTILTTSHTSGEVIRNDYRDRRIIVYGIKQTCHTRVGECRVTNDSD